MQSYESTTRRVSQDGPRICALIQDVLPFYLEGEVSPESRILIGEHLSECELCASFLAGAQSVHAHLRHENMLRGRVVDDDRRAQQIISTGRRQLMMLVLAATVGAIAVFMVVSGLLFPPTGASIPVAPSRVSDEAAPMPPLVPPPPLMPPPR
jgi:predicted anti-sigma-YlaC factor YlaD